MSASAPHDPEDPQPSQISGTAQIWRSWSRWPHISRSRIQEGEIAPEVAKYGDTSAAYWKLYGSEADVNDKKFVESLRGDTESMVFLNTLFSAIVASFIIEIYKTLLPDNSQKTVDLLSQLVSQPSALQSPSPANLDNQSFDPPSIVIRINIVLFISFFLSMMSAVGCALIQQWCHEYMKYAYPRGAPHECGRVRTYLFRGLHLFQMRRFMYGTHVLLHISVFLFFWAISDFFYTVHQALGAVSRYCLVASLVVYMVLSILPLIFANSPYNTPLTHPLGAIGVHSLHRYRNVLWRLQRRRDAGNVPDSQNPYTKRIRFDKGHLILREAERRAEKLDRYAMEWLLTDNDFSDDDMYKFLEGLPGYISSRQTKQDQLDEYLTAEPILDRIREHFLTCATSLELSEEESISRVLCCVKSLRLIFQHGIKPNQAPSEADKERLRRQMTYVEDIIGDFATLCDGTFKDPVVALRASCVRALAVQGLLTQLAHPEGGMPTNQLFPMSLIPLYNFFFPNGNRHLIQQIRDGLTPNDGETKKMWKALLSDAPLINLTKLAEAVRSREDAPPSSLSFCWKALERLVNQLGIAVTKASDETEHSFKTVHDKISAYVKTTERGFRISPLLDILDVVIRGQRLALAFSSHREYHSRADLVFEKEHLRNADLLEPFARCLPDYIASIDADKRRKFMEDMVCKDDLWTSVQVHLWNARKSDRPTPDKLRIFEHCCAVLDVAFSSLEGSTNVDWRAPEFGSLAQHFDSFITHCFQDAFMGRATSFHVGMIRARCSKALLTQFCGDNDRDGTIFFRSQWDVASLARMFCGLSIGDGKDSDVKFWKSYVNGGHIGAGFTAKARETIYQTARDGPLLIFYKLGYLATTAVPLYGSGLGSKDLEKVWELLRNMIKNERPALNRASAQVWEKLGALRGEVSHLCDKLPSEDRDKLRPLLEMIDVVCTPASKELSSSPSEYAPAEGAVTPASHLREQRGSISRSSFSSDSTAVTGGRSGATSTGEDNSGDPSTDTLLDPEKTTQTPLSSSYNEDFIIGALPLSVSPVNSYLSYTGDTGRPHTPPNDPYLGRTRSGSGFSTPWPSPATRMGASTQPKSPRPVPLSYLRGLDLSNPHQPGTSPSQNSEVGEDG